MSDIPKTNEELIVELRKVSNRYFEVGWDTNATLFAQAADALEAATSISVEVELNDRKVMTEARSIVKAHPFSGMSSTDYQRYTSVVQRAIEVGMALVSKNRDGTVSSALELLHFGCNNPDHKLAYLGLAKVVLNDERQNGAGK